MNREDIIRMAREVGIDPESDTLCNYDGWVDTLVDFAVLVAAAERKAVMQLFTDPENQPTQHGTVTVEYMQREIAAEREACAKAGEDTKEWKGGGWVSTLCQHTKRAIAAAIRARGQA